MENQNVKVDELIVDLNLNDDADGILKQLEVVPDDQLPDLIRALADLAVKIDIVGAAVLKRTIKIASKLAAEKAETDKLLNGPVMGNA